MLPLIEGDAPADVAPLLCRHPVGAGMGGNDLGTEPLRQACDAGVCAHGGAGDDVEAQLGEAEGEHGSRNLDGVSMAAPMVRGEFHAEFGFAGGKSGAAQSGAADECVRLLTLDDGELVVLAWLLSRPVLEHCQQVPGWRGVWAVEFGIAWVGVVGEERWGVAGMEVAQQEAVGLEFHLLVAKKTTNYLMRINSAECFHDLRGGIVWLSASEGWWLQWQAFVAPARQRRLNGWLWEHASH